MTDERSDLTGRRVAIIGCGRMGRVRAEACAKLGVPVTVVYDADPAMAAAFAREHPPAVVAPDLDAIDWSAHDAAFLCTPPSARTEAALAAIAAGVPFLMEKPLAPTAGSAMPLVRALRDKPIRNAVGFHNRYRPSVQRLRRELAGRPPLAVAAHWIGDPYAKQWWLKPEASGGPLNDQASHLIDICRYLLGEIEEVTAVPRAADRPHGGGSVAVALRFASGTCGTMLYSYLGTDKRIGIDLFGADGQVSLDDWDFHRRGEDPQPGGRYAPFLTETAAFLARDGEIRSDVEDALRTLAVVDTVRASMTGTDGRR